MLPGVEHIAATIEALEAAIDDRVAALFVEPIQGEAGVLDLPDGFLQRARELTAEHGALLMLDEIQTGVARTGPSDDTISAFNLTDSVMIHSSLTGSQCSFLVSTFSRARNNSGFPITPHLSAS